MFEQSMGPALDLYSEGLRKRGFDEKTREQFVGALSAEFEETEKKEVVDHFAVVEEKLRKIDLRHASQREDAPSLSSEEPPC